MITNLRYYIESTRPILVIAAVSLALLGIVFTNISFLSTVSLISIIVVAFITSSVYSFNYWTDLKEDRINLPSSAIIKGKVTKKQILLFSFLVLILALVFSIFLSLESTFITIFIFFLGFVYSYPVLPKRTGYRRFKELSSESKSVIIALGWAIGFLIPVVALPYQVTIGLVLLVTFLFLQIFMGTITRDFKDMQGDIKSNIKTIPIKLGWNQTLNMFIIINTICIALVVAGVWFFNLPSFWLFLIIGCVWRYIVIARLYSGKKDLKFICEKMNVSTCMLFAIAVILGRYLIMFL
jgi:4-hydroxybenzoate polyprenyltransferase